MEVVQAWGAPGIQRRGGFEISIFGMLSCSGTLLCLNLNGMEGSAFGLYSEILHILGILKTLGGGGIILLGSHKGIRSNS